MSDFKLDSKRATNLVAELMSIPGKSCQEGKILAEIKNRLLKAGLKKSDFVHDNAHIKAKTGGEVGNLIVKLPGTIKAPRRLLMAHVDTVPLCVGSKPKKTGEFFKSADPKTALGGDDRSGTAVLLSTLLTILENKIPHPPLTFFWAIQEEIGLLGAKNVSKSNLGKPALCFNFDGGIPNMLCIGATGDIAMEITVRGLASHAGVCPEAGISAIAIAGLAIASLQENGWHGQIQKGKKQGTSNIGVISGGDATNVVTNELKIKAEARSHDTKFRQKIVGEFRKAFEKAVKSIKNNEGKTGSLEFESHLKYESFKMSKTDPTVKLAQKAIESVDLEPELKIGNGGLDANWMTAHGFPTVTLGCGQADIHTVSETLHIPSYLKACQIGLHLATDCS